MQIIEGDCLEVMKGMGAGSVDLVIGSPPYAGKGERYGTGWKWDARSWVDWMHLLTQEAVRVSRNVVVWVANGYVLNGAYHPACEGLIWRCFESGIRCERPCIWHKNSAPCKRPWWVNDWEFCMAFRPKISTEYFDWESIAQAPKYSSGGKFRQRNSKGDRPKTEGGSYPKSKLALPRDVMRATVGGGHMGHPLAHQNEAPFPQRLIEPFVKALCPPTGTVLDPFCGSGTTLAVAEQWGRESIGIDIRASQIALSHQRTAAQRRTKDQP